MILLKLWIKMQLLYIHKLYLVIYHLPKQIFNLKCKYYIREDLIESYIQIRFHDMKCVVILKNESKRLKFLEKYQYIKSDKSIIKDK